MSEQINECGGMGPRLQAVPETDRGRYAAEQFKLTAFRIRRAVFVSESSGVTVYVDNNPMLGGRREAAVEEALELLAGRGVHAIGRGGCGEPDDWGAPYTLAVYFDTTDAELVKGLLADRLGAARCGSAFGQEMAFTGAEIDRIEQEASAS
ncbi:MAG: hypothetical protein KC619_31905 [Myxococcales bacterium]|nr:hypothetical protein [Myxococcales bacterium]